MSDENKIVGQFNDVAIQYDSQREKLIPCYHDFYGISVSITDISEEAPNILDLGAGTGLFSAFMLKKYPNASFTLIDLSEKMIEVARQRFQDRPNFSYIVGDYTNHDYQEKYDLVISSLSIHHLTDAKKNELYTKIFDMLKPNGLLVNADQVLGSSSYIEQLYKEKWREQVEKSGLTQDEIVSAYERTKLDKMAPLANQLEWLKQIGFTDVECMYKYLNFVVIMGRKLEKIV